MFREFIDRLLSYPQRGQVQIDFDKERRLFRFSVPVFSDVEGLPVEVKDYVNARKNSTFKPHVTSYRLEGHRVLLVQEVPFSLTDSLRAQVDQFWQMSQHCHQMLSEIAQEHSKFFLDYI
ncbi:MAG: hypothetical protein WCF19_03610 [Chlamydiales bacterium]